MRDLKRFELAALLLLTAGVGACGSDDDGSAGGADAGLANKVSALFELPRGGPISEFYALPFPNDLRRKADGTIDLDQHVRPNAFVGQIIDTIAAKSAGFGTNAAIYVRFSGEIDPAKLPADATASLADTASVYLVDVDPDSPDAGKKTPLRFRFQSHEGVSIGANWLGSLPYPGFPMRPSNRYALVVTNRLTAKGGGKIESSADFSAVMGTAASSDAAVTAARSAYRPLRDWLDAASSSDDRDDVISAAVFTTQDPVSLMGKLRQVVAALPAPVAQEVHATTSATRYKVFEGKYDSPNFQDGDPPYLMSGGEILLDSGGLPKVQRTESLRFAVTIPKTAMPAGGWPIVLYAHGTGGNYRSFIRDGTADRMADEGLAAISIDQVLHEARDPTGTGAEITFFNIYNAIASRDNVRQGAVDDFQLVRLAKGLTVTDGQLSHKFDAGKIYFMGHSQGGLTGPPFLAYEPDVKAAVLSGAGSLIYFALLYKTQPDEVDIPALVMAFVKDFPLDEFNNIFALLQMFIEPADPANYGPLLIRAPLPSVGAKHIFQSEGITDHFAPSVGIEALGVATGLSPVAPIVTPVPGFGLRGITTLSAPVMSNLGGKTGVFMQYTAPAGDDGHFVIFDVPAAQRQHARFLGTLARTGMATLEP